MNESNESEKVLKITPIEAFEVLMDHPLKMQIFFYLTTFNELSLSKLVTLLGKSKTTIHHHTRILEQKGILITKEKITRNYTEKIYRIHTKVLDLISSKGVIEKKIKKGNTKISQMSILFQSFSAIMYSIMERFTSYLTNKETIKPEDLELSSLGLIVTDFAQYKKTMSEINKILSNLSSKNSDITPKKDSYAIFTVCLPYGKIFEDFLND